jgi:hypothetical protein
LSSWFLVVAFFFLSFFLQWFQHIFKHGKAPIGGTWVVSSLWLIGGPLFPSWEREREREREGQKGPWVGWQNSHGMDLLLAFEN